MAEGLHVVLHVADIDRSISYYKSLGFSTARGARDGLAWGEVSLKGKPVLLLPRVGAAARKAGAGVHVTFGVPRAATVARRAVAMAAPVAEPLHDLPWGGRGVRLVDPDGYVLSFVERVPGEVPVKQARRRRVVKVTRPAAASRSSRPAR